MIIDMAKAVRQFAIKKIQGVQTLNLKSYIIKANYTRPAFIWGHQDKKLSLHFQQYAYLESLHWLTE